MKAFVFVKFEPDVDMSMVDHALDRDEIKSIDLVVGEYDAIVTIDVADLAVLGKLAPQIRSCPGIRESMTMPVIEA